MVRLRHYDHLGTARFVTFSCFRQLPNLDLPGAKEIFVRNLQLARELYEVRIHGYVLMPEHAHLVLTLPDHLKLGRIIGAVKSRSAREYFLAASTPVPESGPRAFWQRRCYDHNCRTPSAVVEKINYCHGNPVRRGLVADPGDWEWSSYNSYRGCQSVPLKIDAVRL